MKPNTTATRTFLLLALATTVFVVQVRTQRGATSFVIRNAKVFDGNRLFEGRSVLVSGGLIQAFDTPDRIPTGATEIDATGQTLLPGFIDAHTHVPYKSRMRQALSFGITTELDMFSLPDEVAAAKALLRSPAGAALADLYSAGICATAPGGHGTEYGVAIPTLQRPDEAPRFVADRVAQGADYLKIIVEPGRPGRPIPTLTFDTIRSLVDEAHKFGMLAIAHVSQPSSATQALLAGADGLAHLWTGEDEGVVALAAKHRAFVIPTLTVIERGVQTGPSGWRRTRFCARTCPPVRKPIFGSHIATL